MIQVVNAGIFIPELGGGVSGLYREGVENAAQERNRTVPKPQEKPINKYMYIHNNNHLFIYIYISLSISYIYIYIFFYNHILKDWQGVSDECH